ncbi:phosphoglycerate mutase-like protein 4 isoform X1 [Physcomitrium patens]|uniref:Histidine phosphatase family protein n=3 Tax=Physcomitrium patens TaxID=3218 RepID=A0A2K1IG53_PHYPA|nr:phosphoglycerate mutase-like protein 4 isoform X1 [Physcomitrium patens]PNR28247.1 hypothetical protein PHYPA_028839 [Physcomitrium patens]|eukprot:XP_024364394.1 phosphoglycerate mutase-like protein 4 isoform X1 [Physcomitrella patens]
MLAESGAEHLSWGIRSWALLVLFVPGEAATMGENAVPSNMAELLVVRHGETSWNVLGRLQGHAESDLNEAGKKQAQAAAEKLASMGLEFAAIYSSDLKRALDTAQAIADKCQCSNVIVRENLRERCLGDLEGLTRSEARTAAPEALKAFMKNNDFLPIPGGGESLEQLCVRVQNAFEQIASGSLGKRVVVVTHGGVLRTAHILATGLPCSGKVVNASINVFRISDEKDWTITCWGAASHLQDIGFLDTGFGGDKLSG